MKNYNSIPGEQILEYCKKDVLFWNELIGIMYGLPKTRWERFKDMLISIFNYIKDIINLR